MAAEFALRGQSVRLAASRSRGRAARFGSRPAAAGVTAVGVAAISWQVLGAFERSAFIFPTEVAWLVYAAVALPGIALTATVGSRRTSLGAGVFWAWCLVFLGWSPAAQLTIGSMPWGEPAGSPAVRTALVLVLLGEVVAGAGIWLGSRRPAARQTRRGARPASTAAAANRLKVAMAAQVAVGVLFAAFTGSALFSGKEQFREAIIALGAIPGGGSVYFLATAGAILVPPAAVIARRKAIPVPPLLLTSSILVGFLVTNPLAGSRFLTGGFIVALLGAAAAERVIVRYLPLAAVVLLVTVFPSLDLFRGDGTGATKVAPLAPAVAMQDFDFDAFEMLVRATVVDADLPSAIPSGERLIAASVVRWVPGLSNRILDEGSGPIVAQASGMTFTNVSMPVWGEGLLIAGRAGVVVTMLLLGLLIGRSRSTASLAGEAGIAALLFIVLRGSLYEVLGYLILAGVLLVWLRVDDQDSSESGDRSA